MVHLTDRMVRDARSVSPCVMSHLSGPGYTWVHVFTAGEDVSCCRLRAIISNQRRSSLAVVLLVVVFFSLFLGCVGLREACHELHVRRRD